MKLTSKVILIIVSSVTLITSIIFYVIMHRFEDQLEHNLLTTARSVYKNILITRQWISDHNGVFVHSKPGEKPNPFLPQPILLSRTGDTLTLKNPALVTRELSELSQTMGIHFSFHMASQHFLNPINKPDAFENMALHYFQSGESDQTLKREFYRTEKSNGHYYFRYFAPLFTHESCLSCHSEQGYKVGDLRGGLSILLSIDDFQEAKKDNLIFFIFSALAMVGFLSFLIFVALQKSVIRPLKQIEEGAQKIQQDDYNFRIQISQKDEIGHLARAFDDMRLRIQDYTSRLKISENKYRSLIENSLEAIFIIDSDKNILECNSKLSHLTKYLSEEIRQKNMDYLIDTHNTRQMKSTAETDEYTEHFETTLFSADRLKIPVEIYIIKDFSLGSETDLSFVYVRDLSERKKIEQYSIQTEKMVALGQISSGIAHEIRNPLFSLNNNLDYLYNRYKNRKEFKEIYPDLKSGIERIHQIVGAILDYARPHRPEFRQIDIHEILEKSIFLVKKQFEKSSTKIETYYSETNCHVEADPHQMEQVFINLFLNAFNAMEDTGILIIRTIPAEKYLLVEIEDTGKGIPEEDIDRIFDPFYSKSANGTGLGLAIVQRILEQHHAEWKVESAPYLGTKFLLFIPYKQEDNHEI
ncbi:MAG: DUF3365 domain-containing protein [Calditrichaeota bacterium]|nr:DUF3365 domain-containing protein [Calditrichota bacterium]RQV92723.1 MAG: DUF3365 domain-containing protein [bacterium]RQW00447.1 MAG: DUF3365 domain-containing protein [Calditrichota bacterium]